MRHLKILCVLTLAFAMAACGSSSSTTEAADPNMESLRTGAYEIQYTPVTSPMVGKSTVRIKVIRLSDNQAVAGLNVGIRPWMVMEAHEHGSPTEAVVDNGDGTYDCDVYYLMASEMNGQVMGTWELQVTVDGETVTFNPDVMMAMGDTTLVKLKNAADMVSIMGDVQTRTYYIFKKMLGGSSGAHTFSLFIATRESMMSHPAVYSGASMAGSGGNWTVNSMTVQVSTDGETWTTMMESGSGTFMVSNLAGLMDGMEGDIYVKLTINGVEYTTDGAAASGMNAYQTFTVTPGGSMSM